MIPFYLRGPDDVPAHVNTWAHKPYWLYHHVAENGTLLYIGVTAWPVNRVRTHSKKSPWWPDVASITWLRFPDYFSAMVAERNAIDDELPSVECGLSDQDAAASGDGGMMRGARLYVVMLLAFVAFVCLAGCAAPQRSEREQFDAWLMGAKVTTVHETIGTVAGWYDPYSRTVHLDDQVLSSFDTDGGTDQSTFWRYHEYGHAAAIQMGLWIGNPLPCEPHNCPVAERAAQCVAQVATGITPTYLTPDKGYWLCPAEWLATTTTKLHELYAKAAS